MGKRIIHQLVHTLSYGDAISGEALALKRTLHQLGHEGEIYAINEHPKLRGQSKHYSQFPAQFDGEVILHYSLGSPLNALYRNLSSAKRTVIHHNLTPPRWFDGVNPRVASDIRAGISEFPEILKLSDRRLADSDFNAEEVRAHGLDCSVLRLPFDATRWELLTNPGIEQLLRNDDSLHILHVGRIAPNKCVEDIIKSFYFLNRHIEKKSRLWLVGIDIDTELYSFSLKRLAAVLGLEEVVHFVGCMDDSEVKSLYLNSSAYLCMSEHEGFCLPLVEAMHFGLPVIAYGATAIPETVATGGIIVNHKDHAVIGELLHEVSANKELRMKLQQAGKARSQEMSLEAFAKNVTTVLGL
jgi:glycosyltransferase involved in cell wall biosynthesis